MPKPRLGKLRFVGCNPVVRVMIESAVTLGLGQAAEHVKRKLA